MIERVTRNNKRWIEEIREENIEEYRRGDMREYQRNN